MARLILLGTGTSDGVPRIACTCAVCTSPDPRDKRLRTAGLIIHGATRIALDCGIDFRAQALRHHISRLDAILFTHAHADHVEGIVELRPLSLAQNRILPCYGAADVLAEIRQRFRYLFEPGQRGGGLPRVSLESIDGPFQAAGLELIPLPVLHGRLPVLGYRCGSMAYITDASTIPESTFSLLCGVELLILNALRPTPHATHFSIGQAIAAAQRIGAPRTVLVHLAHYLSQRQLEAMLPEGIEPGYDGLELDFDAATPAISHPDCGSD